MLRLWFLSTKLIRFVINGEPTQNMKLHEGLKQNIDYSPNSIITIQKQILESSVKNYDFF